MEFVFSVLVVWRRLIWTGSCDVGHGGTVLKMVEEVVGNVAEPRSVGGGGVDGVSRGWVDGGSGLADYGSGDGGRSRGHSGGEVVVDSAAVVGYSTDETCFFSSMKLHAHRRRSGSTDHAVEPWEPKAVIPTNAPGLTRTTDGTCNSNLLKINFRGENS